MKRPFPDPFPRQREQLALGKGTWQEALESLGTLRLILVEGQRCVRHGAHCSWVTSGHLDGTRSQDHPSYV